jgi:pSer/pThr/pTyr-binding forkhead associated (FHA) protein
MAELIGMSAEVKGQNIQLDEQDLTIGRAENNRLPIQNNSVSGHHCRVFRDGEQFLVEDLGSTNGTRVNAKTVEAPTPLHPKDLIQVGSVEFLFNVEGATPEEEEESASFGSAEVVEAQGPAEAPVSFESISPFGARRKESAGLWASILILLGLVALGAVGFVLYTLFVG